MVIFGCETVTVTDEADQEESNPGAVAVTVVVPPPTGSNATDPASHGYGE
jgi:hypothetical protein